MLEQEESQRPSVKRHKYRLFTSQGITLPTRLPTPAQHDGNNPPIKWNVLGMKKCIHLHYEPNARKTAKQSRKHQLIIINKVHVIPITRPWVSG